MTQPTLADRLLAAARRANALVAQEPGQPAGRRLREAIATAIRRAGRYQADQALSDLLVTHPMQIGALDADTGIRLPNPTTWLEFDVHQVDPPRRVGLLIDPHPRQGWRIRHFWMELADLARPDVPVQVSAALIRFDLGRRLPDDPGARAIGLHAGSLAALTRAVRAREAGLTPAEFSASPTGAAIERDLACTNFELEPGTDPRTLHDNGLRDPGRGIANVAGLSLHVTSSLCHLLADRDGEAITRTAMTVRPTLAGRHDATRPRLSYHRLSVALPERVDRILGAGAGTPRREHDCRGHWCESRHGRADCAHLWEAEADQRWRCLACGRKRWWRRAHTRGSRDLGRVEKDYVLTRRPMH